MSLTFTIHTAGPHQKPVPFQAGPVPEKYARYLLPRGEYGQVKLPEALLLFQQFVPEKYRLLFCDLMVSQPVKFIVRGVTPGARAYLMLSGSVTSRYRVTNQWSTLHEGYYEVHRLPLQKKEIRLSPGNYSYLIIYYGKETSRKNVFSGKMPLKMLLLEYFLRESIRNHHETAKQFAVLKDLVDYIREKEVFTGRYQFTQEMVTHIWHAGQNIEKYMDEKNIVSAQFRKTLLKKGPYNEGFRILYGLFPKQFHTKIRMEAAQKMIRDKPGTSLSEIADYLGYFRTGDMVKAYVKYYGYPPSKEK